jgi:hypothetical protein
MAEHKLGGGGYDVKIFLLKKKIKKSEAVPVLNLCHEDIRVVELYLHQFLASALDRGEWSASRHCRCIPQVV